MMVRLREIKKTAQNEYRLTLDIVDQERMPWDFGDCLLRLDILDAPGRHWSSPRGLLKPACDLYQLSPDDPPISIGWPGRPPLHRPALPRGDPLPVRGGARRAPEGRRSGVIR